MSDTKTYVFGEGNSQNGFDPNLLWGMMMGGGGFGGFGGGNWLWPLFLLFLFGGNGFGFGNGGFGGRGGFGFLSDQLNNEAGRDLLMQAIQGNASAIDRLASTLNCNVGDIRNAISSLSTQICNIGSQIGMSTQQIINSLQQGNSQLASQIASCCCDIRQSISESNYLTERAFCNTNQILTKGFSDLGYASKDQTCQLEKAIASSTAEILAGQRAAEMREMQDKIDSLREKNSQKDVIINNAQQTAQFGQMITQATTPIYQAVNHLQSDVDGIKCRLPKTEVIPATPEYVPINRSINVAYGPYCGYGFGGYGAGWNYGNGFCNGNSLWG